MFYVVQRTWFAGADPTEAADRERLVFAGSLYDAAARVAESAARRFGASGRDPVAQTWWARGTDSLHRFEVTSERPCLERRTGPIMALVARVSP